MIETNWAHFEKKLASGKTIDEAAIEMGLSPDIVRERYNSRREATTIYGLEAVGSNAIETALQTLKEICQLGEDEESRIAAAGHLLKFGVQVIRTANDKKRTQIDKQNADGMLDLFDTVGDWVLKKPGV